MHLRLKDYVYQFLKERRISVETELGIFLILVFGLDWSIEVLIRQVDEDVEERQEGVIEDDTCVLYFKPLQQNLYMLADYLLWPDRI